MLHEMTNRPQPSKASGIPQICNNPINVTPFGKKNGYLFIFLMWIAFLSPVPYWSAFPFIIGTTNLSELAIIAMPFVYALYPRNKAIPSRTKYRFLRKVILLFVVFSIFINILQFLTYGGSIIDYVRANRHLIPLFVALTLIYLGPRIKPKLLLANLFLCLSVSFIISMIYFFADLDFTPFYATNLDEEAYEVFRGGRLGNINAGFSYLAVGVLAGVNLKKKDLHSVYLYWLSVFVCLLSIVMLFLQFSRTGIGIILLFILFLNIRFFSVRISIITILTLITAVYVLYNAYNYSEVVQRQVESRIISALQGQDELLDSVYFNNRDILYEDYWKAGKKYFLIGVPPTVPITLKYDKGELKAVNLSDISLVTVFLRLGLVTSLIYFSIFVLFYKYLLNIDASKILPWSRVMHFALLYSFPFIVLASFNVDILARHYSILFVALFFLAMCFSKPVNDNKVPPSTIE